MITLDVRNRLVKALYDYLQIPIIPDDEDTGVPPSPYVVYSVTTDNVKNGSDTISYAEASDSFTKTYTNQKEVSYSFNAHSDSRDEALEMCYRLIEFFERVGVETLSREGIAVIEVMPTQNRSIMLGDYYERRHGFDVRLRYVDRSEHTVETIDEFNL
ncbi:hypothetical protein AAV35_012690 [Salimicrobium jeotgali]|uniref:Phage neck terminator protein gp12-like domain-containing protein n=1 Tax=Salimicrobium jeotgali TaxID=1230341 RepID=K2G5H9_9BACI|nr:hypothetical protein [Salimicrobium jeotgali]AKG05523.1 hypothetical protein AAV35_012690 [Salimicrobium jeotgali]EKE30488.1 hypothetical protein MJ3_13644 [Salimicrobium jeotgali]MBM7696636.1 hypothetical protein [Salimicrobium jeotgali]